MLKKETKLQMPAPKRILGPAGEPPKRVKKEEPAPPKVPRPSLEPQTFYSLEDQVAREKGAVAMEQEFLVESKHLREALETLIKGEKPKASYSSLLLNIVAMRRLGRLAQYAIHQMRDQTAERLVAAELRYLQLQNVRSEVQHLHKEIDRCLEFRSADEEINMVPEEEFYAQAPPSISREEETRGDEHQKRLARLNWEMHQRKDLMGTLAELEGRRNVLASDIRGKEQRLNSLKPKLENLIAVTKPIIELVGGSTNQKDDEDEESPSRDVSEVREEDTDETSKDPPSHKTKDSMDDIKKESSQEPIEA